MKLKEFGYRALKDFKLEIYYSQNCIKPWYTIEIKKGQTIYAGFMPHTFASGSDYNGNPIFFDRQGNKVEIKSELFDGYYFADRDGEGEGYCKIGEEVEVFEAPESEKYFEFDIQ